MEFAIHHPVSEIRYKPLEFNPAVIGAAEIRVSEQIIHAINIEFRANNLAQYWTQIDTPVDKKIIRAGKIRVNNAGDVNRLEIGKLALQNFSER